MFLNLWQQLPRQAPPVDRVCADSARQIFTDYHLIRMVDGTDHEIWMLPDQVAIGGYRLYVTGDHWRDRVLFSSLLHPMLNQELCSLAALRIHLRELADSYPPLPEPVSVARQMFNRWCGLS